MELLQSDLSARTNPRLDGNDEPCAMIKVIVPAVEGIQFEGWVIGNVKYRPGEYQVYVPAGTKKITFRHPDFAPGEIRFTLPIEGKCTYRVVLEVPQKPQGLESVEQGEADALLKQARNYEQGTGAYQKDLNQALIWYEKAAEAGNEEAQEYLAEVMYHGTKGYSQDLEKALKWNEVCAERGEYVSIRRVARYCEDNGQYLKAIKWYTTLNDIRPDKDLQMHIAQLHSRTDKGRIPWLRSAADNGHSEAAYELATQLAPTDVKTASAYFQQAIDAGLTKAMFDYGTILVEGKYGIEKDEIKGKTLIDQALGKGSLEAASRDFIQQEMNTIDSEVRVYIDQVPELLKSVKEGDTDAMLKLILIYKALRCEELEIKMKAVALYNLSYQMILPLDYDPVLIKRAGFAANHTIIDHYVTKSRTIKVYSYPKTEYYKSPVERARKSNYEYMMEYLGGSSKIKDYEGLNNNIVSRCGEIKRCIDDMLNEKPLLSTPTSYLIEYAKRGHEADLMQTIETWVKNSNTDVQNYKDYDDFKRTIKGAWHLSDNFDTQYDIRVLYALIENRKKFHPKKWKNQIVWLEYWLKEIVVKDKDAVFLPWMKQLNIDGFLWDGETAKQAPVFAAMRENLRAEMNEKQKILDNENEKKLKDSENKSTYARAKKSSITTFEANGVAFNVIAMKGGRFGANFAPAKYRMMEMPVSFALWNAVMGKRVGQGDYEEYVSLAYADWEDRKKYYGWTGAKRDRKSNEISKSELYQFIKRLNDITHKRFRLATRDESGYMMKVNDSMKLGFITFDGEEDYNGSTFINNNIPYLRLVLQE